MRSLRSSRPTWSITNLVRLILNRPEFYSVTAKQGLVRTPIEYDRRPLLLHRHRTPMISGVVVASGVRPANRCTNRRTWPAGSRTRYWLNTSALAGRADFARSVMWQMQRRLGRSRRRGLSMTAANAVDYVANFFGIFPLSSTTRTALINARQASASAGKWSLGTPEPADHDAHARPEFHMA